MADGYDQFEGAWGERARLALDALEMKPTEGIPSWMVHAMDPGFIEATTGRPAGNFERDPEGIYLQFQHQCEVCFIDQFIPRNVLSMARHGFGSQARRGATTGGEGLILDGMAIDSPEAVVEHLERYVFPARDAEIRSFPARQDAAVAELIAGQVATQKKFGPDMLKVPYAGGFSNFPILGYQTYGYADYFMAYALYPDVMERDFRQQADLAALTNAASARAIVEGRLPRLLRLDFDMADSRGMLVDIRSLDRLWLPHFARALDPLLRAGIRLIWHCDGNLMDLVPRLLECGIGGFQGFQYEDGMDYERICRMTDRDGGPLFILAGVSSTRTLPFGTPQEVRDQLKWLVDKGPRVGLALGASSSITPNTKHENIQALIEGLNYYRAHGRSCVCLGGRL